MTRSLPISLLVATAALALSAPTASAASYFKFDGVDGSSRAGTGKTMAAEVLASRE